MRIATEERIVEVKEINVICPKCGDQIFATITEGAEADLHHYTCDHFIEFDWTVQDGWVAVFEEDEK